MLLQKYPNNFKKYFQVVPQERRQDTENFFLSTELNFDSETYYLRKQFSISYYMKETKKNWTAGKFITF